MCSGEGQGGTRLGLDKGDGLYGRGGVEEGWDYQVGVEYRVNVDWSRRGPEKVGLKERGRTLEVIVKFLL